MPYNPGADIRGASLIGFTALAFAIGFAATHRNDTPSGAASYSARDGKDGVPTADRDAVRLASDCKVATR